MPTVSTPSPHIRLLSCDTTRIDKNWNQENYAAPYWRLYWNKQAGAEVRYRSSRVALQPDHLVLIPSDTPYAAHTTGTQEHFHIHFIISPASDFSAHYGLYPVKVTKTHLELISALRDPSAQKAIERQKHFLCLSLLHLALSDCPDLFNQTPALDERITRASAEMQRHINRPLSNDQLAQIAAMNTNAFIRLFRQTTGLSPQAWYIRARIDHACLLLHHSTLKIDRIALECGFYDRYHFTRHFINIRKMGPAKFRKIVFPASKD